MSKGIRSRVFTMSLKQDITKEIEQYGKYAWILHDKDVDKETGELKDPHYHIFLEFPNARYITGLANELNIEANMLEVVRNKSRLLRYFLHKDSPEKHQYEISEIHSNFEIEQSFDELNFVTIGELLHSSPTFDIFLSQCLRKGLRGHPATMRFSLLKLWAVERSGQSLLEPLDEFERNLGSLDE